MKIVRSARMPYEDRPNPRGGRFCCKRLLEGQPGSRGNFLLQLSKTFDDFVSPRHRHNFDQVRFQLEGTSDFARDGSMSPGCVGYFPEGTPYGPQSAQGEAVVLVLQFGGASGNGYMSEEELQASVAELKKAGEFREGVFRRNSGAEGRPQQDAYEAAWENHNQRRLEYPKPRYYAPVFMFRDGYEWIPAAEPGVETKLLGRFTECGTEISFLRLAAGARHRTGSGQLIYALSGAGTIAGEDWEPETAIHVGSDECADVEAAAPAELFVIELPRWSRTEIGSPSRGAIEVA
jgi:hypothetical protein